MTPDHSLLVALDRFYNVQEMQIIRGWLMKQRDEEMARAIKAVENSDVARGRAQVLMELVELFEGAPEALNRLERRNGSQKPSYPGNP